MAITIECPNTNRIDLDEYVAYIHDNVDLSDMDSIAASAPMLKALSNDRDLVTQVFNKFVDSYLTNGASDMYTPQSFMLAMESGNAKNFYVRGNIWTAVSEKSQLKALEERVFSYNIAHDHDFRFMTVGYWGGGYETHIYESTKRDIHGYIGEHVPMHLLEKTTLPVGKVMLYRPFQDIHIQLPPPELSISLNLMIQDRVPNAREQYFYDVDKQTIAGYPYGASSFNRCSIIQMASYVGNTNTIQMLLDIASSDPLPRARVTALEGLIRLAPSDSVSILELAATESNEMVRSFAAAALRNREHGSADYDQLRERLGLGLRSEVSTLARASLAEAIA